MELLVNNFKNTPASKMMVSEEKFACAFNEGLVHQVVTAYLSAGRAGTKAQKTRSEVSGGGIKPWRQKGTGRARAGTTRSPLWRKGGVTFAAKPRSYEQKVNKKMYRRAMSIILSELIRQKRLMVADEIILENPKTKLLLEKLQQLNLVSNKVFIVLEKEDQNIFLAARNLSHVSVATVAEVDPARLVGTEQLLITASALKQLEERLI